jgi:hypothetical protein
VIFERSRFFDQYRKEFSRKLSQPAVDGIEFLLGQFEKDPVWNDLRHIAYALATVAHETAWSYQPVEEGYYLGDPDEVRRFQKRLRYYPFFGRGYVQLTWDYNYRLFSKKLNLDFVHDPSLALIPKIAFKIMTIGMHQGLFTGHKLTDHINDIEKNYKKARRIINGNDKAALLAQYAQSFENVLRRSKVSSTPVPELTAVSRSSTSAGSVSGDPGGQSANSVSGSPIVSSDKEDQSRGIRDKVASALGTAKDWSLGPGMPLLKQLGGRAIVAGSVVGTFFSRYWWLFLLVLVGIAAVMCVRAYKSRKGK